ncbi:B-cell antigen receptor complex-associated protein alpha chain [Mastacembelus armatus]|uniref:CD79a molecule, immunoglobulin-associated alpha n=1 Tax=Mastacembelus armatus TaxID=205130 RepID=A0A3Q3LCU1_9TELE|nr:B-cell antigen receptor complex-associated protein alpha chain [Mastacembelus armatus]
MGIGIILGLCSFAVAIAETGVSLMPDIPFLSVSLSHNAFLECCYKPNKTSRWVKRSQYGSAFVGPYPVLFSDRIREGNLKKDGSFCDTLNFTSVTLNDTGLYQCRIDDNSLTLHTHGTYLQVYKPIEKTINLSENTKNRILTAEGILLLLCVLLPSATLLFKSKKLHELEKKKVQKEEENIYQGLNLDECCATYDQIECSQTRGPYQDVCNVVQEEDSIQLEKP